MEEILYAISVIVQFQHKISSQIIFSFEFNFNTITFLNIGLLDFLFQCVLNWQGR